MKLTKIKDGFLKTLGKDIAMRIYSLVIAILAWFVISVSVFPTTTITFKDIPVDVAIEGTSAERNSLNVISISEENIKAVIKGNRSEIGGMTSADFVAKAEVSNITSAGDYELLLTLECIKGNVDFEYSIYPEKVTVGFDRIVTKTFDLTAEIPNIKAADGYLKGEAEVTIPLITISGPEEKVEYITSCAVRNTSEMTLTDSVELTDKNELILYHNNTVTSQEGLTYSKNSFAINVPVSMRKTVPLKVAFTNVPANFPIDELEYNQSVSEIEIAAPRENIENLDELTVCTIDFRKVEKGYSVTKAIEFPDGMDIENLSEVNDITVEFPLEEFTTRVITISRDDITVINSPSEYDIIPVTTGWDVTFIGTEEELEELSVQDILVQLDVSSVASSITGNDYFRAAISISVPDKEFVWAVGSHTVAFQATEK